MGRTNLRQIADGSDVMLNISEASALVHLKPSWLYQLIHKRGIPCYKRGRRVLFSRLELAEWMLSTKRKTLEELEHEAR